MKAKIVATIFLLLVFIVIWNLPTGDLNNPLTGFEAIPDADLRALAEQAAAKGNKDEAINILDYIIENDLPDKTGAMTLRNQYVAELEADKTPLGRIKSFGYGFITGKVDSWETMAGSGLGDFLMYGDIRDLVRETFSSDPDRFIQIMSTVGIGTNLLTYATEGGLWEADAVVEFLKIAKKIGALTDSMVKYLIKIFEFAVHNAKSAEALVKLKQVFMPVVELLKKVHSLAEIKTIMKQAESIEQLKVLVKMVSLTPKASKRQNMMASSTKCGPSASTNT